MSCNKRRYWTGRGGISGNEVNVVQWESLINDKTALITGATSGLGMYASTFASKGCNLIITGRREKTWWENAESLQINSMPGDVGSSSQTVPAMPKGRDQSVPLPIRRSDHRDIFGEQRGLQLKRPLSCPETGYWKKMLYLQVWCGKLTHFVLKEHGTEEFRCHRINISSDSAFAFSH